MNRALRFWQQRMNRIGPVVVCCVAAIVLSPFGVAMLRCLISEDHASHREKPDWCGAALTRRLFRVLKRGFLFQICTPALGASRVRGSLLIRVKCLMPLTSRRPASDWRMSRQG